VQDASKRNTFPRKKGEAKRFQPGNKALGSVEVIPGEWAVLCFQSKEKNFLGRKNAVPVTQGSGSRPRGEYHVAKNRGVIRGRGQAPASLFQNGKKYPKFSNKRGEYTARGTTQKRRWLMPAGERNGEKNVRPTRQKKDFHIEISRRKSESWGGRSISQIQGRGKEK